MIDYLAHNGTITVNVLYRSPFNSIAPGGPEDIFVELARLQGVEPITSLADLAQPELWNSDEEYEEFLADLYASRRTGMA